MRKKVLMISVIGVVILAVIGCGNTSTNNEVDDYLNEELVEETEDANVDTKVSYAEVDIEEMDIEEDDSEITIERGSRQSPYKLGETVTINLFASNLYDVNMIPATVDITLNEYSEKFVECEISLSDCETDSAVDFLVTLFPKIIDTQMTEMGQYTISREPEGLSSSISMYNGGSTTGYIQLKVNDDDGVPQYVVLQYYKCSDINVPKEEDDWTEMWFELPRE